jgi:hypothetical protein
MDVTTSIHKLLLPSAWIGIVQRNYLCSFLVDRFFRLVSRGLYILFLNLVGGLLH